MMNVLAIDTSTERASLALKSGNDLLTAEQSHQKTHARVLISLIDGLLAEAGLTLGQLSGIAFGRGPGSFTGLRVACSTVKGLAYAHDLNLIPVSTLAAVALQARKNYTSSPNYTILATIDARMNEMYWSELDMETFFANEFVSAPGDIELREQLSPVILAGVGFENYLSDMPQKIKDRIVSQSVIYPEASAMIDLFEAGVFQPVSVRDAEPVYIRNHVTQGRNHG